MVYFRYFELNEHGSLIPRNYNPRCSSPTYRLELLYTTARKITCERQSVDRGSNTLYIQRAADSHEALPTTGAKNSLECIENISFYRHMEPAGNSSSFQTRGIFCETTFSPIEDICLPSDMGLLRYLPVAKMSWNMANAQRRKQACPVETHNNTFPEDERIEELVAEANAGLHRIHRSSSVALNIPASLPYPPAGPYLDPVEEWRRLNGSLVSAESRLFSPNLINAQLSNGGTCRNSVQGTSDLLCAPLQEHAGIKSRLGLPNLISEFHGHQLQRAPINPQMPGTSYISADFETISDASGSESPEPGDIRVRIS